MAETVSLSEFERAEQQLGAEEARTGFAVHATVYVLVNAMLIVINLIDREAWWFFYPLIGWGIGLSLHYFAGVRRARQNVADRQAKVERRVLEERGRR